MTLKHMKYEDSTIMHSLEKLMLDKGMIKVDPLKKIAAKQIKKELDLKPTKNLVENIMKLCSGLKSVGLEKYAEELENVFLAYKTAENIYETSKEKGEDLIDQAHPKGSHKLEGVLGDNVVETILDRQLEMLKIVNKKPTGKLSTASNIIKAVKMCFADDSEQDIESKLQQKAAQLIDLSTKIDSMIKTEAISSSNLESRTRWKISPITLDNLSTLQKIWTLIRNGRSPGLFKPYGLSRDLWTQIEPKFNIGFNLIQEMIDLRTKQLNLIKSKDEETIKQPAKEPINKPTSEQVIKSDIDKPKEKTETQLANTDKIIYNSISNKLNIIVGFKNSINLDNSIPNNTKQKLFKWLDGRVASLNNIKNLFDGMSRINRDQESTEIASDIAKINISLNEFKKEWID